MKQVLHSICIPPPPKKELKLVGGVNHVFDRRGSQCYDFNEQIFKRQLSWQNYIEIYHIFTKLWRCVPISTLGSKGLKSFACQKELVMHRVCKAVSLKKMADLFKRLIWISQQCSLPGSQSRWGFLLVTLTGYFWESCNVRQCIIQLLEQFNKGRERTW